MHVKFSDGLQRAIESGLRLFFKTRTHPVAFEVSLGSEDDRRVLAVTAEITDCL